MESISQYVASIVTNPWFALVGFVIGLAGLATAFFFYIKGKKVKLPCYFLSSNNIINNLVSKFDSLEMLYSGQPVENLTVTKLFFWNNGRETIDVQDIPKSDPLKVYVKQGYKILDAKVIFSKNEANQFSVTTSSDKSHINLNFEYLDKNEGGIIQILHTGKSNKDIDIHGKIKGAGKPINKLILFMNPKKNKNIIVFIIITCLIIIATAVYSSISIDKKILIVSFFILFTIIYWGIIYLVYRPPKEFANFLGEDYVKK